MRSNLQAEEAGRKRDLLDPVLEYVGISQLDAFLVGGEEGGGLRRWACHDNSVIKE